MPQWWQWPVVRGVQWSQLSAPGVWYKNTKKKERLQAGKGETVTERATLSKGIELFCFLCYYKNSLKQIFVTVKELLGVMKNKDYNAVFSSVNE